MLADALIIKRLHTLKVTVGLFVPLNPPPPLTKDLLEIIVEQPRECFFLLLKHTHVNVIFYS